MRVLREHFRPEFLNRVDDIVIFRSLGPAQMSHILDLRLNDVSKLLEDRAISLELTEPRASSSWLRGPMRPTARVRSSEPCSAWSRNPLAIKILNGESCTARTYASTSTASRTNSTSSP